MYRTKIFLLRRLLGLSMILDGITTFLTGWKIGLTLMTAKKIAVLRGAKMFSNKEET